MIVCVCGSGCAVNVYNKSARLVTHLAHEQQQQQRQQMLCALFCSFRFFRLCFDGKNDTAAAVGGVTAAAAAAAADASVPDADAAPATVVAAAG